MRREEILENYLLQPKEIRYGPSKRTGVFFPAFLHRETYNIIDFYSTNGQDF